MKKPPAPTRSIRILEAALAAALDDVHDITIALNRLRLDPAAVPELYHCPCARPFTRYASFVAHMDAHHPGATVPVVRPRPKAVTR